MAPRGGSRKADRKPIAAREAHREAWGGQVAGLQAESEDMPAVRAAVAREVAA